VSVGSDLPSSEDALTNLRSEHEQLRHFIMQAPALLCIFRGPAHVYELVNPVYTQVIGGRDVLGKPIREALPELEGQGIFELLDRVYRTGEAAFGKEVHLHLLRGGSDPEPSWFDFVYQPLRDTTGGVIGVLVHAIDMTEPVTARRTAEALTAELRRSEELFRVSQEVSPIGFSYLRIIRDASGAMVDVEWEYQNEAASRFNGLPSGTGCRGVRAVDAFPALAKNEKIWEAYKRVAATGVAWQDEVFYSGDDIRAWLRMSVVRPNENALAVSSEDVTAAREAAERQQEAAETNHSLLRFAQAIHGLDLHAIVQRVTEEATAACRAQFGAFFYNVRDANGERYTLYTLAGVPRSMFERFPMPRNTAVFAPTFNGEGVVRSDDITKDPRFGKTAPYHGMPPGHLPVRSYLAVPVVSRSGEVLGGLFFGHEKTGVFTERDEQVLAAVAPQTAAAMDSARLFDVAQRERLRAEEANRAKDEFLATISHELRTPLNAMLGWTRMLRGGTLPADKQSRALETIERNARAQVALIEDVLDVSRIISGKLRLDVRSVNLNEIVEASVETARPAADAKGVRLQVLLDPDAGTTMGDSNRLQQVVWNLLSNAVKFTPRGGRVHVSLHRENSHVQMVVADTGQGMSPEFLPYAFDRFRQADPTITRSFGGLGIGLSIVKHLVELHGGTVAAESEGPGLGATFTVRIPVAPLRSSGVPSPAPRVASGDSASTLECPPEIAGLRILVVDDEPDARDMVRDLLLHCNAEVHSAADAAEALAILARHRVDILISDVGMPVEDGYALIRKVRALPSDSGGQIPAVALTAYARSEDRTRALVTGFSQHVAKPVDPAELLVVVANLAGRFGLVGR
jgi:signal transduction histidine kinase